MAPGSFLVGHVPLAPAPSRGNAFDDEAAIGAGRSIVAGMNVDEVRSFGVSTAHPEFRSLDRFVAGAGRTGYWFTPERPGKDGERITLNPSGFSVSTVLPSVGACALLSVPR